MILIMKENTCKIKIDIWINTLAYTCINIKLFYFAFNFLKKFYIKNILEY